MREARFTPTTRVVEYYWTFHFTVFFLLGFHWRRLDRDFPGPEVRQDEWSGVWPQHSRPVGRRRLPQARNRRGPYQGCGRSYQVQPLTISSWHVWDKSYLFPDKGCPIVIYIDNALSLDKLPTHKPPTVSCDKIQLVEVVGLVVTLLLTFQDSLSKEPALGHSQETSLKSRFINNRHEELFDQHGFDQQKMLPIMRHCCH